LCTDLLLVCLSVVAICAAVPPRAHGEVRIPPEAVVDEAELQRVVQQGQDLESQQRWAEALTHYEMAVREFPGRQELWDRLALARLHYDVGRRYQDATFRNALAKLTERQALDLYSEVLQKIETHYVKQTNWQELARRGVENFNVALTEPVFKTHHLSRAAEETLRAFREELQRRMDVTVVRTRQDAREVAAAVGQLAAAQVQLRPQATVMEFACGAACALDQYSTFLTSGELEDIFSQIEGNFVGLGIELKAQARSLAIISLIPGGPAEQGGIRPGDRIIEVNGVSTANVSTDDAANLLKGPEGSGVDLKLVDAAGAARQLRLVRRRVDVPSVTDVKIVDADYGIGYLRLTSFQKTTPRDVDAALWKLYREGLHSLIVDVRGNPGGLLTAAVEIADRFLESGSIVSTRGRSSREDFDYRAHNTGTWRVPLLVLIDGDTASASEIFAGAIHDHHRGTVIGQRSYGKGSVQGIFPLDISGAGVRLTTAKFYSPNGQAISDRGVVPDVVVRVAAKPVANDRLPSTAPPEDPVLKAALQVARTNLTQSQAKAQ
jgi:carboxyl-terminal processing protease